MGDIDSFHDCIDRIRLFTTDILSHDVPNGERVGWPKALDLGCMAVHYSGGIGWSMNSETGGMSVGVNLRTAEEYMGVLNTTFWIDNGYLLGETRRTVPQTRVLSFVQPSSGSFDLAPHHARNEGADQERILPSVHLSGFDPMTQELIKAIFGENGNPEYIEQA